MKVLGNLIWFILGGFLAALLWLLAGLLLCATVLGIPFGVQCMKIAGFVMWPFGRYVIPGNFGVMGALGNIIWILCLGIVMSVTHLVLGLVFFITIIGIPFGLQHFKLAKLSLIPFGAQIQSKSEVL